MRLGGRLAAAIEVLEDMDRRQRPAADALRDWGVSHRFAGAGDRAAIGNIVYDALRRRRSAAWLFDADTARAAAFGALVVEGGRSAGEINGALDGDRFAPPMLDDGELSALAARDLADAPDAVRGDCPDWCAPFLQQSFGDDWVAEARALATRPPLDLRANTLVSTRDAVIAELGGEAGPMRLAADGIRIPPIVADGRHPNLLTAQAFQDGWFEIQDEGSQLAATLAGARPGMQVLDYCAGAGGKTLALSAAMQNRGQIFAHDAEKARIAPIFERLQRAQCRNVQVVNNESALAEHEDAMDLVLIDAPCTGSGTWRRRPDAKWRLTQRQLDARIAEQAEILAIAARFVKPGGRLVYITCSVFPDENQRQVEAFLAASAGFVADDHAMLWAAAAPQAVDTARVGPAGLLLSPQRSGTDGFFFAAMTRHA